MSFEYHREPLEDNEIAALKKSCKTFEEALLINVFLDTGIRVGELAYLKDEDIDWKRNCLKVSSKGSKKRTIPMSNEVRFFLTKHFSNKQNLQLSCRTIQRIVQGVAKRARIQKPISPHVLRHTFAVSYLHKGGNSRALQELLGHRSIKTTDIYLNYSDNRVQEDFERIWYNKREKYTNPFE